MGSLSISIATGRNWVKLGKITPQYIKNGMPYFDKKHIAIIENEIRSGKNVALKAAEIKNMFPEMRYIVLMFPKTARTLPFCRNCSPR